MRRRFSPASVLSDLARSGGRALQQRVAPVSSGVGGVVSPAIGPQAILGGHYAETRNVIPFSFDDSIDPTHALDCFFQMPVGVLKIYSAKLFVRAAAFRAYTTSASSSGGSLTSAGGPHSHAIVTGNDSTAEAAHVHVPAAMGNQSALHTHVTQAPDAGGTTTTESANHVHSQSATGAGSSHAHAHGGHFVGISQDSPAHTHTVDTSHTHGIVYGIYESTASTGNLTAKVADNGINFSGVVASGPQLDIDIKDYLSTTAGDRQVRIETSGAGAQARVKVLLMLDVLLTVSLD